MPVRQSTESTNSNRPIKMFLPKICERLVSNCPGRLLQADYINRLFLLFYGWFCVNKNNLPNACFNVCACCLAFLLPFFSSSDFYMQYQIANLCSAWISMLPFCKAFSGLFFGWKKKLFLFSWRFLVASLRNLCCNRKWQERHHLQQKKIWLN